jgi:hypothetical protein
MRAMLIWVVPRRVLVISDGRFGTNYLSHLQGSILFLFLTLEDGTDRLSETSVRNFHYSLRNNPDERISRILALRASDWCNYCACYEVST